MHKMLVKALSNNAVGQTRCMIVLNILKLGKHEFSGLPSTCIRLQKNFTTVQNVIA